MRRYYKVNHSFSNVPSVRIARSQQNLSHSVTTTMNVGTLYPVDWQEVLPGDTFIAKVPFVSRVSSSFLKPVMDNLFLDTYHFFVPYRLLYQDAEKVFGNPKPSAYTDNALSSFPKVLAECIISSGSVGDYLGLPINRAIPGNSISVLPFRAFALIYEKYFRNENVVDEIFVQQGDATPSEHPNGVDWSANNYFGMPPKVSKYKDYFTSCLPQPQKGQQVVLPTGDSAPVITSNSVHPSSGYPLRFFENVNGQGNPVSGHLGTNNQGGLVAFDSIPSVQVKSAVPGNLVADLSQATAVSVNDQRLAFALQKMLERDAIYGSRYNEFLLGHFGVVNPDARLQFPEPLGGSRSPLNVQQVAQTSQGTDESPLANLAGYSWTNGSSRFTRSFTEHGIVMTVCAIRFKHSYQNGLAKKWTRSVREDFYDPLFATIGQQPVYRSEVNYVAYIEPHSADDLVFGYKEAWSEYRQIPNTVTGEIRSGITNSLDLWTFADNYTDAGFSLSKQFVEESPEFVNRSLSVESSAQDNFIIQFYFDITAYRPMPVYSMPGLIDHH